MAGNPKDVGDRIQTMSDAWDQAIADAVVPATKKFKGMTKADFDLVVKPSLDARKKLAELDLEVTKYTNQRNDADKLSLKAIEDVFKGVAGDEAYGDDCDLYEQMGRKRKSEYGTGLTRKKAKKSTP
jgi:hypothetical protein